MANVRKSLAMRVQLPEGITKFLLTGEVPPDDADTFLWSRDRGAVRRAWRSVRAELIAEYIRENPGRRPWAFWKFDLSEPRRRRIAGRGDLVPAYDCGANVHFGIFGKNSFVDERLLAAWRKINCQGGLKLTPIDENDLPKYESSASFLDRHGLLSDAERAALPQDAFEPEAVR